MRKGQDQAGHRRQLESNGWEREQSEKVHPERQRLTKSLSFGLLGLRAWRPLPDQAKPAMSPIGSPLCAGRGYV
jgi:hypothetical protein